MISGLKKKKKKRFSLTLMVPGLCITWVMNGGLLIYDDDDDAFLTIELIKYKLI
jgi:hypothetical protein